MRKLFESWNSYLLEIMDNPAETTVGVDDSFERIVFFEVGNKEYTMTIARDTISSLEWNVSFFIQNAATDDDPASGYSMQNINDIRLTSIVFATVIQEIKKFLYSRKDEFILLSLDAATEEPSRVRFYDFLMKRLSPRLKQDGFVTGAMQTDRYRTNIIFNPDYLNNGGSLTRLQRSDLMVVINNLVSGQEEVKKAFFNAGLRGL